MSHAENNGRGLGELFTSLASDVTGLFRKEMELAKAEAGEKLEEAMKAGRNLAIGGILAIGAVGVFLAAIVSGLTMLLVRMGWSDEAAGFVSALIVALVVGGIAWTMVLRGIAEFKATKLNMKRTTHALHMDAAAVRESL
jgi:MFS family permease